MRHVPCKKLRIQVCNAELQREDGSIIECGQEHVREREVTKVIDSQKERRASEWLNYLLEAAGKVIENYDDEVPQTAIPHLKRVAMEYQLSQYRREHPEPPPEDWRGTVHDAVIEGRIGDALSILLSLGVEFVNVEEVAYSIKKNADGTFVVDMRLHPSHAPRIRSKEHRSPRAVPATDSSLAEAHANIEQLALPQLLMIAEAAVLWRERYERSEVPREVPLAAAVDAARKERT